MISQKYKELFNEYCEAMIDLYQSLSSDELDTFFPGFMMMGYNESNNMNFMPAIINSLNKKDEIDTAQYKAYAHHSMEKVKEKGINLKCCFFASPTSRISYNEDEIAGLTKEEIEFLVENDPVEHKKISVFHVVMETKNEFIIRDYILKDNGEFVLDEEYNTEDADSIDSSNFFMYENN